MKKLFPHKREDRSVSVVAEFRAKSGVANELEALMTEYCQSISAEKKARELLVPLVVMRNDAGDLFVEFSTLSQPTYWKDWLVGLIKAVRFSGMGEFAVYRDLLTDRARDMTKETWDDLANESP